MRVFALVVRQRFDRSRAFPLQPLKAPATELLPALVAQAKPLASQPAPGAHLSLVPVWLPNSIAPGAMLQVDWTAPAKIAVRLALAPDARRDLPPPAKVSMARRWVLPERRFGQRVLVGERLKQATKWL